MNSTPVTPDPITIACSGISGGGYASRVVSTRSPSTGANSGTRGREPVDTSTKSASISSSPASVVATTQRGPVRRPVPRITRTLCDSSKVSIVCCTRLSIDCTRSRSASMSRRPSAAMPIVCARLSSASSPPVAISAFDGMQSHRWAAPPTTSRSMTVTSAPSVAATLAHVLPAGPPPITTR